MKIKLRQPVVFDGITYPANHVLETEGTGISAESIVQREWGDEVSADTPESKLTEPEPISPEPEPISPEPIAESIVEPVVAPVVVDAVQPVPSEAAPVVEAPVKSPKRRGK
jgi:hypothetical protein